MNKCPVFSLYSTHAHRSDKKKKIETRLSKMTPLESVKNGMKNPGRAGKHWRCLSVADVPKNKNGRSKMPPQKSPEKKVKTGISEHLRRVRKKVKRHLRRVLKHCFVGRHQAGHLGKLAGTGPLPPRTKSRCSSLDQKDKTK